MCNHLLVVLVVTTLEELGSDIVPRLTLVVVSVPFVNTGVEDSLESKGTSEDGGDVDRVSSEQGGQLELLV